MSWRQIKLRFEYFIEALIFQLGKESLDLKFVFTMLW